MHRARGHPRTSRHGCATLAASAQRMLGPWSRHVGGLSGRAAASLPRLPPPGPRSRATAGPGGAVGPTNMSAALPRSSVTKGRWADEHVRRATEVERHLWGPPQRSRPTNVRRAAEVARHRGSVGPTNMSCALPRSSVTAGIEMSCATTKPSTRRARSAAAADPTAGQNGRRVVLTPALRTPLPALRTPMRNAEPILMAQLGRSQGGGMVEAWPNLIGGMAQFDRRHGPI